jgi:hypothetical protein
MKAQKPFITVVWWNIAPHIVCYNTVLRLYGVENQVIFKFRDFSRAHHYLKTRENAERNNFPSFGKKLERNKAPTARNINRRIKYLNNINNRALTKIRPEPAALSRTGKNFKNSAPIAPRRKARKPKRLGA